jgi:hypothetical protein
MEVAPQRVSGLLPVRNAIVHQPVKRTGKASDGRAIYEYAIYPEPFQPHRKKTNAGLGEKGELLTTDLETHAASVQGLEADLKLFLREVQASKRSA